jgi:tryptophan-rich sensory protein
MKIKEIITITRIIALLPLIAAIFFYSQTGFAQIALLVIAGLLLLAAPNNYAKKNLKMFIETFKLKQEFAWAMVYDAGFWVVTVALGLALWKILNAIAGPLMTIPIGSLNPESIGDYNSIISAFFTKAVIALVIIWLLIAIAYGISRGLIWLKLLEKPLHMPFFFRFGLINIFWFTAIMVLFILIAAGLKTISAAGVVIVLFLAYTHITTVMHYSYVKNRAFAKAISEAFGTGIGKILAFIHPYCYIFMVYVLVIQLLRFTSGKMMLVAAFLIYFVFMAWYRIYMRNILRRIA